MGRDRLWPRKVNAHVYVLCVQQACAASFAWNWRLLGESTSSKREGWQFLIDRQGLALVRTIEATPVQSAFKEETVCISHECEWKIAPHAALQCMLTPMTTHVAHRVCARGCVLRWGKGVSRCHGCGLQTDGRSFATCVRECSHEGDSYYEYLLKQWIQGGKKDARILVSSKF